MEEKMAILRDYEMIVKKLLFFLILGYVFQVAAATSVVLLAGDSTMADYPESRMPLIGWGQALKQFALPETKIHNFALSGSSSKSFRSIGRWDNVLNAITDGCVVLIQFGHNDAMRTNPDKYADPAVDFPANLKRFVEEVRARNGVPILCTPVAYRAFNPDGTTKNLHGDYPKAVRQVAREYNVPLLDLTAITEEIYQRYGAENSKQLFKYCRAGEYPAFPEGAADNCHFNARGASEAARAVIRELYRQKLPGANRFAPPEWNWDFSELSTGQLPSTWTLWRKNYAGTVEAVKGQYGPALQVTGAESAALQYDLPVKAGETYVIRAEMQQTGKSKGDLVIAWKGENRKWLSLARIPGIFQVTGKPLCKAAVKVTVPKGAMYLCAMLTAAGGNDQNDKVWFYRLTIRQIFESGLSGTPNEPAPRLNFTLRDTDYPIYRNNTEVLKTLRMAIIKHSDVIGNENFPWITPATAAATAKKIKNAGYNCILTEGQRFLMRDIDSFTGPLDVSRGSLKFPELVQNTKIIADAFHLEGLKVYLHLTSGLAPNEFYRDHPNWMVKSVLDNGNRKYWGLNWICQNNVEYGKEYRKRLAQLVEAVRPDALMIDETSNMYDSCGCPDCRARFTADTGLTMPEPGNSSWFRNLDSPIYRKFLQWRIECVKKENDDYRAILRQYVPDGVLLSYYSVPYNQQAWYDHGISLESSAGTGEIFGLETISNYRKYWAMFIAAMKLTRYVAEQKLGTAFTITAFPNYDVLYSVWLLNLSQGGHQYWSWYQNETLKELRAGLVQWEMLHERLFSGLQSAGEVAVVFSSRDLNLRRAPRGRIQRQNVYLAIANNLTLAQIPYRATGDLDMERPIPDSVKVIIAMDFGLLTDNAVANLRNFVAKGGKLIASNEFSLYDAEGKRRTNFALADVLGCDFLALTDGEAILKTGEREVGPVDALVEVKPRAGAKVVGTMMPGTRPGLIHNRFGQGEAWYLAGSIAPAIYFNEFNGTAIIDRDNSDERRLAVVELFRNLIDAEGQFLKTEQLPPGVVVEKFLQDGVPQLHVLNYSGMMTDGRPETDHFNFPEIRSGAITIPDLKCARITAYSPEFNGKKNLQFERKDGTLKIMLPDFRYLLLIRFE